MHRSRARDLGYFDFDGEEKKSIGMHVRKKLKDERVEQISTFVDERSEFL
jgi:hypothetical protein